MLKVQQRKRQVEVKTFYFNDTERSGSVFSPGATGSNDSGIDEIDAQNASPGRPRTNSQGSSLWSSQNDLTYGAHKVERTNSNISEHSTDSSMQCRLFINSDTDSDIGSEGYQVCMFLNCLLSCLGSLYQRDSPQTIYKQNFKNNLTYMNELNFYEELSIDCSSLHSICLYSKFQFACGQ